MIKIIDTSTLENCAEEILTKIWEKELGSPIIFPEKNFFDNGGDSIGVTNIIFEIRKQLNLDLSLEEFFDNPTIKSLSFLVNKKKDAM